MAGWVIAITGARGNAEESLAAGFGKLFRDKGLASKEQVLFFFPETGDAPESSIPKMQSTPSAFVPLGELERAGTEIVILRWGAEGAKGMKNRSVKLSNKSNHQAVPTLFYF